jgi:hypothetical protein
MTTAPVEQASLPPFSNLHGCPHCAGRATAQHAIAR